jgi:hypothetical protein
MLSVPSVAPLVLLPLLAHLSPRGLTIETRSPDAHCPDLAMTQRAAEARLGVVKVEGGQSWRAVYTIVYARDKDGNRVHLELFDPKGERQLERDLPLAGESCATMTQAIVLVLERYFRDFGWLEDAAPGGPVPETKDERPVAAPAPAAFDRPASPPKQSERFFYRGSIGAGGGFTTPPSGPALTISARLWLLRSLHFGLGMAWSPGEVEEPVGPPGGVARSTSIPARASLGWGKDLGWSYLFAGPEILASFDRGSVSGVAQPGDASRIVLGLGVGAGALIWLKKPLALSVDASVDGTLPLATSQFVVSNQEVLRQQWVQGLFSLGLTYVVSP